jgi:hypothetical protein
MKRLQFIASVGLFLFAMAFTSEIFAQIRVRAAVRLYRPKYGCNHKMSLCIGKKKNFEDSDPILAQSGGREPLVYMTLAKDKLTLKIDFAQTFDKSDGTTLTIDEGYNNFEMEDALKKELGVQAISIKTGDYPIDLSSNKGSVILPVKTQ